MGGAAIRRARLRAGRHLAAAALALLGGAGPATAYFSGALASGGGAAAQAGTLPGVAAPALAAYGNSVHVIWSQASLEGQSLGTYTGGGYTVQRFSATGGASSPVGGSCAGTLTGSSPTLSCSDAGVPPGTWYYEVTPVLNGWVGPPSAASADVRTGVATDTLSASVDPASVGTPVRYTATVSGTGPTPTGTVTFADAGVPITGCGAGGVVSLSSGVATCSVTYSSSGSHAITAAYGGDAVYGPAAGNTLTEVVRASSVSTLTANYNPVAVGAFVVYTAGVTGAGGTPTGSVTFEDDGVALTACGAGGAVSLSSGVATCTVSYAGAATHTVTAVYGGDGSYAASTSSGLTETVAADSNTLTLSAPSTKGSSGKLAFSGTASAAAPVTVYYCTGALSTCPAIRAAGSTTVTLTSAGTWTSGVVQLTRGATYTAQAYQTDPLGLGLASAVQQFTP